MTNLRRGTSSRILAGQTFNQLLRMMGDDAHRCRMHTQARRDVYFTALWSPHRQGQF
jgi:hypothetical protein